MAFNISAITLFVLTSCIISINGLMLRHSSVVDANGKIPFLVSFRALHLGRFQQREVRHFCSGSIISDRWILSAAHCFREGLSENRIIAVAGADAYNDGGEIYQVNRIVVHSRFDPLTHENDIAAVQTIEQIQYNDNVFYIPLLNDYVGTEGFELYAAAWARTDADKTDRKVKRDFKKVLTVRNKSHTSGGEHISTALIAAVPESTINTKRSMSGGPVILFDLLVGVYSSTEKYPESNVKVELFTRISEYTDWIELITGVNAS